MLLSVEDSDTFSFCYENYEYDKLENLFKNPKYIKAMKPLTNRQKLILHLSIVEEWNQKEIAEFIGVTIDSVKNTKSQAIQKFLRNFVIQKYKKEYAKSRFYNCEKLKITQDELNLEETMGYLLIAIERLTIEKAEFNEENITEAFLKTLNAYSPEGAIKRADIILKKIGIG